MSTSDYLYPRMPRRISRLLCLAVLLAPAWAMAQQADSLEKALTAHATEDTGRVTILTQLAFALRNSDPVKGLDYARKAQMLAVKLQYKKGEADSYNQIGVINYRLGEYDKASEAHFSALTIREAIADSVGMAKSYLNIGNVYSEQKNNDKALYYYLLAVGLAERHNVTKSLAGWYSNIGTIYFDKKSYADAQVYFSKALQLAISKHDNENQALALNNIGAVYREMGQYDEAMHHYDSAFRINERAANKREMAIGYIYSAGVRRQQKQFAIAHDLLDKAQAWSTEVSNRDGIQQAYEELAKVYRDEGKPTEALKYYERYLGLHDSLVSENNAQAILDIDQRFKTEKQSRENLIGQKELERSQEANRRHELLNYMLFAISGLLLVLVILAYTAFRNKQRSNQLLALQKQETERSRSLLEEKNKDVTDSIVYSRRIQNAILPSHDQMHRLLPDSFVIYRPKDIVSGDFFWIEEWGSQVLVAAVDCTGHGVPGALMSIVGHNLLGQAVNVHGLTKPHLILNALNKGLSRTLRQHRDDDAVRDGMDVALLSIDRRKKIIEFAGANNPLWLVRNGQLTEISGDKQPIGNYIDDELQSFSLQEITVEPGDCLYIFTDGFADQFGGQKGKKLKYTRFRELLCAVHHLPMEQQRAQLDEAFDNWRGSLEQVDDVLVIGIRC